MSTSVYVVDNTGTPLLPTCPSRARLLLKRGKVTVYSVIPFTVQLVKTVENPVGEFEVGIDDGAKTVGVSVKGNNKIVFAANVSLRQDVSRLVLQRAQYRRSRRSRKLRHRPARFLNKGKKGWLPPSIQYRKEVILRVLRDLIKRLNITSAVIEQGSFDVSSMSKGYKLTGKEYQLSEYEGNNWRQKVLWRDHYTCSHCGSKDKLQAHHIRYKSAGGTGRVTNGITLCHECHASLHKREWELKQTSSGVLRYPAYLQQGKWWIFDRLNNMFGKVRVCYGWMTSKNRKRIGLPKDHHYDAAAMLDCNVYNTVVYNITPRRTKIWESNPTKRCTEKKGFRHFDIVKAKHGTRGIVIGSIRSLKAKSITLRTGFSNNFPVSYNKSRLLWRPKGLIYTYSFL